MKLSSLVEQSSDQIKAIAKKNPFYLMQDRYISRAIDIGLLDFVLEMDQDDLSKYVTGDWTINKWKDKDGRERSYTMFDAIYQGESYDVYDSHSYDGDWESALDYHVNQENEDKIRTIVNGYITKSGQNPEDFNDHSLQDLINEFDEDNDISIMLSQTLGDCEADSYMNYLREQMKEAIGEYGEVMEFSYGEPIKVKIEMDVVIEGVFNSDYSKDDEFLDILDRCRDGENNNDPNLTTLGECIFDEIMGYDYLDRPSLSIDDRWYPDVDDNSFNGILEDRLLEIE